MAAQKYYSLMASLPYLRSPFGVEKSGQKAETVEMPLTRYQLDRRLSALGFDERKVVNDIQIMMHWDREEKHALPDPELIRKCHQVRDAVPSPLIRDLINWILDMRTVIHALRLKQRSDKPPEKIQWSYGTRYVYIRRNWTAPGFSLNSVFPWLEEAERLIVENHSLALEKLLMEAYWQQLDRYGSGQRFNFEALVIYLLRWDLINRWSVYNGQEALSRFDTLVDDALGDSLAPIDSYE